MFVAFSIVEVQAQTDWPRVALSKDGTPISYEVYGAGEPTIVFVHGWSCDARYWREQVPYFSKNHRVVVLDLAGHGHSGSTRSHFLMIDRKEEFNNALEKAIDKILIKPVK